MDILDTSYKRYTNDADVRLAAARSIRSCSDLDSPDGACHPLTDCECACTLQHGTQVYSPSFECGAFSAKIPLPLCLPTSQTRLYAINGLLVSPAALEAIPSGSCSLLVCFSTLHTYAMQSSVSTSARPSKRSGHRRLWWCSKLVSCVTLGGLGTSSS